MVSKDDQAPRHYFDWAATAVPRVFTDPGAAFGNPSSLHLEGKQAREKLEEARSRCAAVLGTAEKTIYFTSGGTESNSLVLHSALLRQHGGFILYSAAEHPSVRENCHVLERLGKQIGTVGVDHAGRVSPELFGKALEKYGDVRFAALMAVNNETGAASDIKTLSALARSRGGAPVHIHCDMVQALGKIPVDISGWDIDSASASAHKLGGPRGIGLLYLRRPLEPLYSGGGQEGGIRPGTENTAGALALAECLELHCRNETLAAEYEGARRRWDALVGELRAIDRCALIPEDRKAGDGAFSPYILQAAFKEIPGEVMIRALDDLGFACSTGSACSSSSPERPVLAAMGVDPRRRVEGIRISQGWSTTDEEIRLLTAAIREVLRFL
jgi:cysteine desulfurase